jgi:putative oxidoreductase
MGRRRGTGADEPAIPPFGVQKVTAVAATQGYMAAYGLSAVLLWPAAALELGGGVMLLLGLRTRQLCFVLACWCLLTAAIFHTAFADQNQLIHFFKNMTMAGGFLALARTGVSGLSVDALLSARRAAN